MDRVFFNIDALHAICQNYKHSFKAAKNIAKLFLDDKELETTMLAAIIMGRFITVKWETLTKKQKKTDFIKNLSNFKSNIIELDSNDWFSNFQSYFNESEWDYCKKKLSNMSEITRKQFDKKFKAGFKKEIQYIYDQLQVRSFSSVVNYFFDLI